MLVIDPDTCIDCGVCEPECPIDAIIPDTQDKALQWLQLNRDFSKQWPNITRKGTPPKDAINWETVKNKYPTHFSAKPGKG